MKRVALLLTLSLAMWTFGPQLAEAQQTGTVQGRVVTESGQNLAGAQVSIEGTGLGGLTNSSGRYLILNVPTGEHTLTVQSMGYGTASTTVSVSAGEVTTQNFRMGQEAVALDELTVSVGSRASHTAADELPVPVDVVAEARIQESSSPEFMGMLEEIVPSIWAPQQQLSDLSSAARPFEMRGLSPDQSLVLIDGMRRHRMAVVDGTPGWDGASGVDLNAIPFMAFNQAEVLKDGASSQYGSDAIAGVINLQLKDQINPLTFEVSGGKYFPRWFEADGDRLRLAANWGFEVPGIGGVLNLTGDYSIRTLTSRAGSSNRDQVVEGDADKIGLVEGRGPYPAVIEKNNPVPQPTFFLADSPWENEMIWANYTREVGEDGDHEFQLATLYSDRNDQTTCFRRRGLEPRNWKTIYPMGFMPTFDQDTEDIQVISGFQGPLSDWNYSLRGSWGQNRMDNTMTNTLNTSLGPSLSQALAPGEDGVLGTADDPGIPNSRKQYNGSLQYTEYVADATASRPFDVGMASDLTLTFGAQFRLENYQIIPGEMAGWVNGFHPNQYGGAAAAGSQCFMAWRGPEAAELGQGSSDATDESRTNIGVFAEGEVNLTESILANAGVRFENYSDFGSTVVGKLALRFQPVEQLIIRGSASTGFRAPTMGQAHYLNVTTGFTTTDEGSAIAYESGTFPPTHPVAQALGADELHEETSVNLAGGIAVTPVNNLNITVDGYWIDLTDAIMESNSFRGDEVEQILANYSAVRASYMVNALNVRSSGFDVTANYRWLLAENTFLEFNTNASFINVEVQSQDQPPPVLANLGEVFFSRGSLSGLENSRPSPRANTSATLRAGPFRAVGTWNYYGSSETLLSQNPDVFWEYDAKSTFDISGTYNFDNGMRLTVGAENVTDVMPPLDPDYEQNGIDGAGSFDLIYWFGRRIPDLNGRYIHASMGFTLQ